QSSDNVPAPADVAAAAAIDAGATVSQVSSIVTAVDAGAPPAVAAKDAGLSSADAAQVSSQVSDSSNNLAHPADVALSSSTSSDPEPATDSNMPSVYNDLNSSTTTDPPTPKTTLGSIIDAITSFLTQAPANPSLRSRAACTTA
ncbi:unnamed protein product, partial [Aphanomyces euteiches]